MGSSSCAPAPSSHHFPPLFAFYPPNNHSSLRLLSSKHGAVQALDLQHTCNMSYNNTLVCVPLVCHSLPDMLHHMHLAKSAGADLVEIRLDHLSTFNPPRDLPLLLRHRPLPALVTYRPKWEGGEYEGHERQRLDVLRLAVDLGADYVDVELKVAHDFMKSIDGNKREGVKIIVSSHNYQMTPSIEEIGNLAASIQSTGADIVKIATFATNITDVARIFQIIVRCQVPMIGLVMSERGLISRLLCPKFGGFLTFGTLDAAKESAPGQPTVHDLLNVYNVRHLNSGTKVLGLIGNPVSHSKGAILYNEAFKSVGINAVFVPLLVDDLPSFLQVYSSADFVGFSCTIPHKEIALKCCDEVDPVAMSIGAVNTLVRRPGDGKLIGYNTDYFGAISAIEDGLRGVRGMGKNTGALPLAGKVVVVIGAGGAGKAVAYGAKEKGARVVIANRSYDRARALADLIGGDAIPLSELDTYRPEEGTVLANTTSVGLHPITNETPISKQALPSYSLVFDAIYTPKMTRLLREAEECGVPVVTGVEMFVRQAVGQFDLFTGISDSEKLLRDIVSRSIYPPDHD